ncbi:MAG: MOSC domain-containing protein [Saprospiraceae bacterium]|nr:MOSC domain-containing protein [Saprospiraceae bacterium]
MKASVIAVHLSPTHTFSKYQVDSIQLLQGLGVEGDAHCGALVKHRSRVKIKPRPVNLRQVHLIHSELFAELESKGFVVTPGLIGENITTKGIDILSLPQGTKLAIGTDAIIEVTGLRNPCNQLNDLQAGLTNAVLEKETDGTLIRKSGIMGIVIQSGEVKPGDPIKIEYPERPFIALDRV